MPSGELGNILSDCSLLYQSVNRPDSIRTYSKHTPNVLPILQNDWLSVKVTILEDKKTHTTECIGTRPCHSWPSLAK